MASLDELLEQTDPNKKTLDDLLRETEGVQPPPIQTKSLDDLLMETESRPTLPAPQPTPLAPSNLTTYGERRQQNQQDFQRNVLTEASKIPIEKIAAKKRAGQQLSPLEQVRDLDTSGQVIPTRLWENIALLGVGAVTPIAQVGPAVLGTVGRSALGLGLEGAATNITLDLAESGRQSIEQGEFVPPNPKEMAKNAGTGFAFGVVGGIVAGKYSAKTKDLADYTGQSNTQMNKFVWETAQETGKTRGQVIDDMIQEVRQLPEGAEFFAKYIDEAAQPTVGVEGARGFRGIAPEVQETTMGEVFQGSRLARETQEGLIESGVEFQSPAVREGYLGSPFQAPETREIIRGQLIEESSPYFRPAPRSDILRKSVKELSEDIANQTGVTPAQVIKQATKQAGKTKQSVKQILVNQVSEQIQEAPKFGTANKIFTQESYQTAIQNIRSRAGRLRTGIDPDDLADYIKIGGYYIEGGARKFADWSTRMIDDFGDEIKPHLEEIYARSRLAVARAKRATRLKPDEQILPPDFNAEALVSDLTGEPAKRTLRNVNIERLDDDALSNFIDNAARQSPEFQIPNDTVGFDVLKERAKTFGTGTIDKYLEDVNTGLVSTPEGGIRRTASEVIAAENVLKNHMETRTLQLAKDVAAGAGDKEALRTALTADLRLLRKIGGVSSEFGRALGSRRIKATGEAGMEQRFLKEVSKAIGKDANLDEIAKWMSNIDVLDPTERMLFLRDLTHATTGEKAFEVFVNSILAKPTTNIRNIVGNTSAQIFREVERPVATTIDLARAAVTRTPRRRFYGESAKAAHGLLEGFREGIYSGWKAFKTEIPQFDLTTKIEGYGTKRRYAPAIKGRAGKIIRIPGRFLLGADEFFKAIGYRMELNARAYREASKIAIAKNLNTDDALDLYMSMKANPNQLLKNAARDETLYRVFQAPQGQIGRAIGGFAYRIPGARFLIPFVRVLANLTEFTAERVPGINFLTILNKRAQGLPVDMTEEGAKLAIGAAISAAVFMAHKNGLVNGEVIPQEQKGKTKAFLTSGRQRYAFNTDEGSISYNYLDPVSTLIGINADVAELMDRGVPILSEDFIFSMARTIGNNLTDTTFGYGWDTFFDLVRGDLDKAKTNLMRIPPSMIPYSNLLRGINQGLDPTLRRTQTFEDAFRAVIPGATGTLEPVFDIWGNEVVSEKGVIQSLFNPVVYKQLTEDPATIEVNRLINAFPDEEFEGLGSVGRKVKGIELTREQYIQYARESGQLAHESVMHLINAPYYDGMPEEIKKKQIEKRIRKAREITRNKLFGNIRDNN